MSRPVKFERGRLAESLIGRHVELPYGDRMLLGEVVGIRWKDHPPTGYKLTVRHFNGEPWPVEASVGAVYVLDD